MELISLLNYLTLGVVPNLALFAGLLFTVTLFKKTPVNFFKKLSTSLILIISTTIFILFHLISYIPGKIYFRDTCQQSGKHFITEKNIEKSIFVKGYISSTYALTMETLHKSAQPDLAR